MLSAGLSGEVGGRSGQCAGPRGLVRPGPWLLQGSHPQGTGACLLLFTKRVVLVAERCSLSSDLTWAFGPGSVPSDWSYEQSE